MIDCAASVEGKSRELSLKKMAFPLKNVYFVTFAVILAVTVVTIAVLAVLDKHSRNATDDAHLFEKTAILRSMLLFAERELDEQIAELDAITTLFASAASGVYLGTTKMEAFAALGPLLQSLLCPSALSDDSRLNAFGVDLTDTSGNRGLWMCARLPHGDGYVHHVMREPTATSSVSAVKTVNLTDAAELVVSDDRLNITTSGVVDVSKHNLTFTVALSAACDGMPYILISSQNRVPSLGGGFEGFAVVGVSSRIWEGKLFEFTNGDDTELVVSTTAGLLIASTLTEEIARRDACWHISARPAACSNFTLAQHPVSQLRDVHRVITAWAPQTDPISGIAHIGDTNCYVAVSMAQPQPGIQFVITVYEPVHKRSGVGKFVALVVVVIISGVVTAIYSGVTIYLWFLRPVAATTQRMDDVTVLDFEFLRATTERDEEEGEEGMSSTADEQSEIAKRKKRAPEFDADRQESKQSAVLILRNCRP